LGITLPDPLSLSISLAGALIALGSMWFAGRQSWHAGRATSIATVQHFLIESRALWQECRNVVAIVPPDEARFEMAVGNVLGHLELATALVVDEYVQGRLQRLVEDTIVDYVNDMVRAGYAPYVSPLVKKPAVCENLKDFCKQRRARLEDATAAFEMLHIELAAL
jgi:hypothetical protein